MRFFINVTLWAIGYMIAASVLQLENTWRLVLLVVLCELWSKFLDALIPTETQG